MSDSQQIDNEFILNDELKDKSDATKILTTHKCFNIIDVIFL